jgi:signal transduction histidine kinase
VAFAVVYAVLAVVARLVGKDGQGLSLIWPGAGIAMLWLLAESPRRQAWVLVPLTVIHGGVSWLTGATFELVVLGASSMACQTWITVALVRRWCPKLLGAGGTESFRSPRSLAYTCLAAAIGSAVGAGIGTLAVWHGAGTVWDAWVPQAWFNRHFTGLVVFGCVGHLAWEWSTQHVAPRTEGGNRRELGLLWLVSALVLVFVFLQPLPIVFLVMPLAVWSAARFPTFLAALHALALGVGGLLLTLTGFGPSESLHATPIHATLVAQIFLVAVLLTGLAVGTLSDRIDELVVRMAEARASAAEQAELLAEMTESMDEGLIVLDGLGRIERSNGASRRLAHRVRPDASEAVALAALVELVLNPDPAHTGAVRAELGVGDVQLPLPSGDDLVLAVSRADLANQQGDGDRTGVLLVLSEVTEHRHGIRPLVAFAATAAHDLRGPLTAIRAWLDYAALDLDPESDTHESVRRAEQASVQMAGLIDDLLTQAVAEAGAIEERDVPLSGPEGALVRADALLGPDDAIEVPDEGLPVVHADEASVRQLFANLVGNSVKYARPGVPALIRVRAVRVGARVVVEVEDNGVGVDEHQRDLIFERFHRGHSDTERRGTGMGLSICQTIVERHGGTIECLPAEPGPGSIFRFDLPAAAGANMMDPVTVLPRSAPDATLADDQLATA